MRALRRPAQPPTAARVLIQRVTRPARRAFASGKRAKRAPAVVLPAVADASPRGTERPSDDIDTRRHLVFGLDVNTKSTGVVIIDSKTANVVHAQVVATDNRQAPTVYEKALILRENLQRAKQTSILRLGESESNVRWSGGVEEFLLAIFNTSSAHALFRLAQVNTLATHEAATIFDVPVHRVFAQTARAYFGLKKPNGASSKRKVGKDGKPVKTRKKKGDVLPGGVGAHDMGSPGSASFDVSQFKPSASESKFLQKHMIWQFAARYFPEGFDWPIIRNREPSAPSSPSFPVTSETEVFSSSSFSGDNDSAERQPLDVVIPDDLGNVSAEASVVTKEKGPPRVSPEAYDLSDAFLVAMFVRNFHVLREGRIRWPSDPDEQQSIMMGLTNAQLALEVRAAGASAVGKKEILHKKLQKALATGKVAFDV